MKGQMPEALQLLFPFDITCNLCATERDMGSGYGICTPCRDNLPIINSHEDLEGYTLYSCMDYDGDAMRMIHLLKFENCRYYAPTLGMIAADLILSRRLSFDCICPVPLHENRMRQRGYNQSALIADVLSKRIGVEVNEYALKRSRDTQAQMNLHREQRIDNVKNAFSADAFISGKHVLLLDDVATTGSTLIQCAKVLEDAGATVTLLAIARTGFA